MKRCSADSLSIAGSKAMSVPGPLTADARSASSVRRVISPRVSPCAGASVKPECADSRATRQDDRELVGADATADGVLGQALLEPAGDRHDQFVAAEHAVMRGDV